MENELKEFGVVGLGRMGGNISKRALELNMRVVGYTVEGAPNALIQDGLIEIDTIEKFKKELTPPRAIFIYIPAGPDIDLMLDNLSSCLSPGDILVDGGNSYWGDSIRRQKKLQKQGIHLVDLGTSGGVAGARNGACFMAGGIKEAVAHIEPILTDLSVTGGYVHAGPPGAGHFIKLVHNGIEFGMLQAIGEGIDLLHHYHDDLDIEKVLGCWQNGSVIRSWLIDLMKEVYIAKDGTDNVPAYIEDTGEVNWLVADAMQMEVSIPVIAQSIMQLFASRDEKKYWARAIAMMRHGFGGHPFGKDAAIAEERKTGRVGEIFRKE